MLWLLDSISVALGNSTLTEACSKRVFLSRPQTHILVLRPRNWVHGLKTTLKSTFWNPRSIAVSVRWKNKHLKINMRPSTFLHFFCSASRSSIRFSFYERTEIALRSVDRLFASARRKLIWEKNNTISMVRYFSSALWHRVHLCESPTRVMLSAAWMWYSPRATQ